MAMTSVIKPTILYREVLQGDDLLKGADQGDYLEGLGGADKIKGKDGSDYLSGGRGNDRLLGGTGEDTLYGGKGKDALFGGVDTDQDAFHFENGDSGKTAAKADRVHDFTNGTDVIDLSALGADESDVHIKSHNGNSIITIDAHDGHGKMVIVVVDDNNLQLSDINFAPL